MSVWTPLILVTAIGSWSPGEGMPYKELPEKKTEIMVERIYESKRACKKDREEAVKAYMRNMDWRDLTMSYVTFEKCAKLNT